jgi:hypothetical protein
MAQERVDVATIHAALESYTSTAQNPADADLRTIHAAMEWYQSSIQSYSVRYRTAMRRHPAGAELWVEYFRKQGRDSEQVKQRVEQVRRDIDTAVEWHHEVIRSGERLWEKHPNSPNPEQGFGYKTTVFDGKRTYELRQTAAGQIGAATVAQRPTNLEGTMDSPLVFAGLQDPYAAQVQGLHVRLKPEVTSWLGRESLAGTVVYHLATDPINVSDKHAIRTHVYVDPEHDYLPLRIWSVNEWSGKPRDTWTVTRFDQVRDQGSGSMRWFPVEGQLQASSLFSEGVIDSVTLVTVEKIEINACVPEAVFEVKLPDGIAVMDLDTRESKLTGTPLTREEIARKSVADAQEQLDEALKEAAEVQPAVTATRTDGIPWLAIALGSTSVASLLTGIWLWWRR